MGEITEREIDELVEEARNIISDIRFYDILKDEADSLKMKIDEIVREKKGEIERKALEYFEKPPRLATLIVADKLLECLNRGLDKETCKRRAPFDAVRSIIADIIKEEL